AMTELFFGYSRSAYWIKFTVENQRDEPMHLILEASPADIDYLELYVVDPHADRLHQHKKSGAAMPYGDRDYDYPLHLFDINIEEHTAYTYFLRAESDKAINLQLTLSTPHEYLHIAGLRDWWQGFLLGALLIAALLHAGLFAVFRFKGFLWYSLFLVSVLGVQISWNGYLLQFYPNSEVLLDHQLLTPVCTAIFFSVFFSQALLKTRKRVPWQHHTLTIMGLLALLLAVAVWFISPHISSVLVSMLAVLNMVFVFAAALHANMEDHAMARHFLAVRAITTGVVLVAIFNVNGYLPQGAFTAWGVAAVIVFESVIMAISMAWCRMSELRQTFSDPARETVAEESAHSLVNLSDVCHELRTPISGVLGMADLLLSSTITDQQRNQIKTISKSGQALLDVTNKLSDLSSIERGTVELNSAAFELTPLIESCIENCRGRAEFNNIELIYHLGSDVAGFFKGDQDKIQQTIINLLQFALRHVEQGEVVLSVITGADKQLVFSIRSGNNTLVERSVAPNNREFGSSDHLNLIIAEQYIKLMGGTLLLQSFIDGGVNISFGLFLETHYNHAHLQQDDNLVLHGRRMLIVDDNATCCTIIEQQAAQWGMVVQSAHGGKEALAILRSHTTVDELFDVVLMDYEMPGMNGLELAAHICEDQKINSENLLMIMLTGVSRAPSKLISENVAIQRVLYKPLSGKSLKQALQAAFAQHLNK
ncbi:MAG TPA: 7TM diverse intracellular signaling domain-containing protein, partial [Pseudomonadales bacterium]|nr:7TM diverse intracellular signaling domain-containing protein [Pseudomonadales bacterium]